MQRLWLPTLLVIALASYGLGLSHQLHVAFAHHADASGHACQSTCHDPTSQDDRGQPPSDPSDEGSCATCVLLLKGASLALAAGPVLAALAPVDRVSPAPQRVWASEQRRIDGARAPPALS